MGEIRLVIPDDLHMALKLRALRENKTLKAFIIELLWEGVNRRLEVKPNPEVNTRPPPRLGGAAE